MKSMLNQRKYEAKNQSQMNKTEKERKKKEKRKPEEKGYRIVLGANRKQSFKIPVHRLKVIPNVRRCTDYVRLYRRRS